MAEPEDEEEKEEENFIKTKPDSVAVNSVVDRSLEIRISKVLLFHSLYASVVN